jgi:hypothetical protein
VSTQTTPDPLTPAAPGGRAATMVIARTVVAVDERDGLAVAAQQIPGGHVDQREFGRVVLKLQGHRGDVRPPVSTTGTWKVAPAATGPGGLESA